MKKSKTIVILLPIFFAFFVMGFVDVVGIATSYVKTDFELSERVSGFLPSMVFLWFLLLAIPSAILMNKIGRKNTVLLSMIVTIVGMCIPFIGYTLATCYIAFALLGIGNTILQVSLNPLVSNMVQGKELSSSMTGGQVIKALSSFCGPLIAAFAVKSLGSWHSIFPIYAVITLISGLWLYFTPVEREMVAPTSSMKDSFGLLKDSNILLLFLGILAVVGIDVGLNMESSKLLMGRFNLTMDDNIVKTAPSVYFFCRTIGAFVGTALLVKVSTMKYFKINMLAAIILLCPLFFLHNQIAILVFIGLVGFACASIFSVVFSLAMRFRPDKANEISGLMVTGIVGGAIFPPLMTGLSESMNSQNGALIILGIAIAYLLCLSFMMKDPETHNL